MASPPLSPFPVPPSHRTFDFGSVVIDSNFDSGNCSNAERVSNTSYRIWIGLDNPKSHYRTWFHFSLQGLSKHAIVTFRIMNMQNQTRLLGDGLVPVFREEKSLQWRRVTSKVNMAEIEYGEGYIEWNFKHTMTSDGKVFFAFFYPWSNEENDRFLQQMQSKCGNNEDIYFKRSRIINSLEGRPVDFLTISSSKGVTSKPEAIEDPFLFPTNDPPMRFSPDKKAIILGARVHPGQVPSSHVMTGIIMELTENNQKAALLRDKFVFYIFPIFNPDGVARGHYRVDPNGINLNRCYINPNPKLHSPIYAAKKIIMHFNSEGRYFAFLDLHAHAARKGIFIYGNSSNELQKQVDACIFPKILSLNSQNFEYEGSNFTEQNMYCKDQADHISKEGAGRVAIFKATKNPNSWTLQCNYNMSRVLNVLEHPSKEPQQLDSTSFIPDASAIILNCKPGVFKDAKDFYTIATYHQLGKEICDSFLDLAEINPQSRIEHANSRFKSIQNLRLNLAMALLRMAPNRFESVFKKIYYAVEGNGPAEPSLQNPVKIRALRALHLLIIKKAHIQNMSLYLKEDNETLVSYPAERKKEGKSKVLSVMGMKKSEKQVSPIKPTRIMLQFENKLSTSRIHNPEQEEVDTIEVVDNRFLSRILENEKSVEDSEVYANIKYSMLDPPRSYQRLFIKPDETNLQNLRKYRQSLNRQTPTDKMSLREGSRFAKISIPGLPVLAFSRVKPVMMGIFDHQLKTMRKGTSAKGQLLDLI